MTRQTRSRLLLQAGLLACMALPCAGALAQTSTGTQQYVVTYGELAPSYDARRTAMPQLDQLTRLATQYGAQYFTVGWEIGRPNFFSIIQVWSSAASYAKFTGASNVQQAFNNLKPSLIAPLDERDGNLVIPQ